MGLYFNVDEFLRPIVKFIMGVPALNWVIIVIIWFSNTELRIGFVLVVLCTPVVHQGRSTGVLYLEHALSEGVFTAGRLELIDAPRELAPGLC